MQWIPIIRPKFFFLYTSSSLPWSYYSSSHAHSSRGFWISYPYLTSACLLEIQLISLSVRTSSQASLTLAYLLSKPQHNMENTQEWAGREQEACSRSLPLSLFIFAPVENCGALFYLSSGPSAGKNIQSRVARCPPWPVLQCRATSGHGLRRTSSYCGCMFEIWPNFNTPKNWLSKDFTGHVVPETTTQVFQARIIRSRCFMCERYHRDVCQKCGSRISWMWLTAIVWHFEKCICLLAESWMRGLLPLISFALYRVRAEEAWKREAGLLREGGAAAPTTTRHYKKSIIW